MLEQIKNLTAGLKPELVKLRRQIHSKPELGFQEYETARLVSAKLKNLGLEVTEAVGRTGVVGLLRGERTGKTVALRADMDALPITEQNESEFKSLNKGVMHACGHDAHTTMLLGAATVLASFKKSLTGNVKFIFQPCEEKPPGGAIEMIKDGVLENPKVDAVFGLHVDPLYPVGIMGYKEGAMMAAVDNFTIEVMGKGGHGAAPHLSVDAVVVSAEIIQALQTIVSRRINPLEPVVLSIGTIQGGYQDNIVADLVTMTGTVRTLDPNIRREIPLLMDNIIKSITMAHNASYKLLFDHSYPPLINNESMVKLIKEVAAELIGRAKVMPIAVPSMGGEDFAYYAERVPSAFFNLGVGRVDRENFPLHHPKFTLDEDVLPIGTALLAYAAVKFLKQ